MPIDRRDLSAFLVHLTRDYEGTTARENLISILKDGRIEARTPLGVAVRRLEGYGYTEEELDSQRAACFSETPIDDLHGLIDPGVWRANNFRPYGIVFSRETLINRGANPVWYLNTFSGPGISFKWLTDHVNNLIDYVALDGGSPTPEDFAASDIGRLAPYIETMGRWGKKEKDFSFEREWRFRGDFDCSPDDIVQILTPTGEADDIRSELLEWGCHEQLLPRDLFRTIHEHDVL